MTAFTFTAAALVNMLQDELAKKQKQLASGAGLPAFLTVLKGFLEQLNSPRRLPAPQYAFVEAGVLQNSYPAFRYLQMGDAERASKWVIHTWEDYAKQADRLARDGAGGETLLDYDLAVHDALAETLKTDRGRAIIRRLMTLLSLGQDELGRMFEVSGETIRRWERGQVRIPPARLAALESANASLARMLSLFVTERLPEVIRRKAGLFDGERALDWILRGRIGDAASRYETALRYQA